MKIVSQMKRMKDFIIPFEKKVAQANKSICDWNFTRKGSFYRENSSL